MNWDIEWSVGSVAILLPPPPPAAVVLGRFRALFPIYASCGVVPF